MSAAPAPAPPSSIYFAKRSALAALFGFFGLFVFCGLLGALSPARADTAPVLPAVLASYLDASGAMSAEQIEALPQSALTPQVLGQSRRAGSGALWLRFTLQGAPEAQRWLALPLPIVGQALLFYRDASGQAVVQRAGADVPKSQWTLLGRYPVFALATEPQRAVTYWLQIRYPLVPFSTTPQVLSDQGLLESGVRENLVLGGFLGLAALMLALSVHHALVYRDRAFLAYSVYAALFIATQIAFTGVGGLYLWPERVELNSAYQFLRAATTAALLLLLHIVLRPQRYAPWLSRGVLTAALACVGLGLMYIFAPSDRVQTAWLAAGALSVLLMLALGVAALLNRELHSRWVAAGLLPILVGGTLPLLQNAGVIGATPLSPYNLLLGFAVGAPIFYYGLLRRVSQLRYTRARADALDGTDPLTGLVTPRRFSLQVTAALSEAKRRRKACTVLLIELSNAPLLRQQHGRETADHCLVLGANCIRASAYANDTVARLGDKQFAVLCSGSVSPEMATRLATKIIAAGLRPLPELREVDCLRFLVAIGTVGSVGSIGSIGSSEKLPTRQAELSRTSAASALAQLAQALKDLGTSPSKSIVQVAL